MELGTVYATLGSKVVLVEALETIRNEQPDLVFLDVMMPKKNGFDVCDAVKNELGLSHIHIILLTAKGQEFDRKRGQEVGADLGTLFQHADRNFRTAVRRQQTLHRDPRVSAPILLMPEQR